MASKYKKLSIILTMCQLSRCLENNIMVYINHKVYHKGFIIGMRYRTLDNLIKNERIWIAEKKENKKCPK